MKALVAATALFSVPAFAFETVSSCSYSVLPAAQCHTNSGVYDVAGTEVNGIAAAEQMRALRLEPGVKITHSQDSLGNFYFEEVSKSHLVSSTPWHGTDGHDFMEVVTAKEVCVKNTRVEFTCKTICLFSRSYVDNR